MSSKIRGLSVRQMRRMGRAIGMSVYQQGSQWILSCPVDSRNLSEQIPLCYAITTERMALADGLKRAGLVRVEPLPGGVTLIEETKRQ